MKKVMISYSTILIITVFSVSGCGHREKSQLESMEIRIDDLESQIDDLESQLSQIYDLESQIDDLESRISYLEISARY